MLLNEDRYSPSAGSVPEISKPAQACSSFSSDGSIRENVVYLGGLVGFHYGEPPLAHISNGADADS